MEFKKRLLVSALVMGLMSGCVNTTEQSAEPSVVDLTIVSANMWLSLNKNFNNKNSFDLAIEELKAADADVLLLSEAGGVNARLAQELGMYLWQGSHQVADLGILSKYPIVKVIDARDQDKGVDHGGSIGAVININGTLVNVWANHLDWTNYITYDARGGNGESWQARENCEVISDSDILDKMDRQSRRPAQMEYVLDKNNQLNNSNIISIIGGDFNEPSGLDLDYRNSNDV
ncbi:endonuclease/exonuclease/phosphatase family protein [Vibrio sp. SS-MA-C1-2]|uniref:endonuclease/exonuclease/phosphatase family protein n=1 Tax=Vibrio sp. SS-MA-C1-2 TaxID=2908646 RepID=UPI001F25AE5E|nr:endonuclease/exonuclease/phosphatase family protein [Vibrio sp. SS-MA-C1-2]UJF17827.1 endonuclease/exonuclease/phosphatase family protein [Vibrio sp. SS-MA-C1-2]